MVALVQDPVAGFELEPELRQRVSPSLIESNYILSLSLAELEQAVAAELDSNPALEADEEATCPICGQLLDGRTCQACAFDPAARLSSPADWEDEGEAYPSAPTSRDDADFDPLTLVATDQSLVERVLADVRTMLPADEAAIAEYLLSNLDERGYLDISLDQVAALTQRPVEAIERILRLVQEVAPVGVAARDVRECLLLQLAYLAQQRQVAIPPTVWQIVADHLDDLATHKYGLIARRLGLSVDDVVAARDFIRAHLNPFPLQESEARRWQTPTHSPRVAPDVIIVEREGELHVEVVESRSTRLRINPLYASLAGIMRGAAVPYSAEERQHVREHVARAKLFMTRIEQRRETMRKISECLVELQADFVRGDTRALRPLTRGQVAERVGLHESTVSRATSEKYVMLPSGRVVPFSDFFTASLGIKDVIKDLISSEQGTLTDQEICERLRAQGYRLARRTVAKYRAQLGILPSTLR